MPDRLFVYGTLKPGESMGHLFDTLSGQWEKASVQGEFKDAGTIDGFDYPGVILNDKGEGDIIDGYLFTSDDLDEHWDQIDRYEGSMYRRVETTATTEDGNRVQAYIYEFIGSPPFDD